jgi:hypothetical protein
MSDESQKEIKDEFHQLQDIEQDEIEDEEEEE